MAEAKKKTTTKKTTKAETTAETTTQTSAQNTQTNYQQAAQNAQQNQQYQQQYYQQPKQKYTPGKYNYQVIPEDKIKAILGYVIVICAIVFLCMDDSGKHARFHYAQAICLWVIAIAGGILGIIPFLGIVIAALVSCAVFVLAVWGIIKVAQDEPDPSIPVLGDVAYAIFGSTIEKGR
jgi:uncharacterized membrane protein